MKPSKTWTAFLSFALKHRTHILGRIALFLRRRIIWFYDPSILYRLGQSSYITIPLSHNLPIYKSAFEHYDTAIIRILRFICQGSERITIIDVGANVGDTTVALLASGNCQVIAIEGNQEFLPYLKRNLGAYARRSTIIPNYVGLPGVAPRAAITSSGTASLKVGIGSAVKLRSVSSIVSELALDKIELIKIDTDGFDIEILLSSIDWLSVAKPILFFEFYPKLFSEVTKDGWCIFGALESIGYIGAIIYLNTGAYLRSLRPKDAVQVEELRALLCSIDDNSYVDILAFADEEKFSKFNGNELQYFCAVGKT